MDSLKGLSGVERVQRQAAVLAAINKRMSDADKNIETRVSALFKGNQFLVFVYQRYTDIRLVGAHHLKVWASLVVIPTIGNGRVIPATFLFSVFIATKKEACKICC